MKNTTHTLEYTMMRDNVTLASLRIGSTGRNGLKSSICTYCEYAYPLNPLH